MSIATINRASIVTWVAVSLVTIGSFFSDIAAADPIAARTPNVISGTVHAYNRDTGTIVVSGQTYNLSRSVVVRAPARSARGGDKSLPPGTKITITTIGSTITDVQLAPLP